MKPNVAIIISNYNYGPYVIEAIESAINQTYAGPLRVYVLDDGSSDDSWEKISAITEGGWGVEELDTKYYKGPIERRQGVNVASMTPKDNLYAYKINNSGASTARNVAMWEAWEWSDIFGILDADDLYKPNKVEILVESIEPSNEIESHVPKNTIKTDQQNLANNNTVTSSINLKSELIRIGISASIIFLILIGYSLI